MPNRAARTAWGPMVQVALEQFVPEQQRIVQDALAYRFLPAYLRLFVRLAGSNAIRERLFAVIDRRVPGIRGGILCRKRYIDDRLSEALNRGIATVVVLGAGMDTRAFRSAKMRAITVYEVDLPENVKAKAVILQRVFGEIPSHVRLIPVDFECQDVGRTLEAAGLRPEDTTFYICEGVTQYITETAVRRVLESLQTANMGSRLAFTYIRRDFIDGQRMYDLEELYRQTRVRRSFWQFGLEPAGVDDFLKPYGWRVLEQVGSAEYQERYLRPVGRLMPVMAVERVAYAEKRDPAPSFSHT